MYASFQLLYYQKQDTRTSQLLAIDETLTIQGVRASTNPVMRDEILSQR